MPHALCACLAAALLLVGGPTLAAPKKPRGFVRNLSRAPTRVHAQGGVVEMLATPKLDGNRYAFLGILTLPVGARVPEHRDATEEYLFVLAGQGTIWIDGVRHAFGEGDVVYMPANAKVRAVAGKREVRVLQVFAGPGPERKYDAWNGR